MVWVLLLILTLQHTYMTDPQIVFRQLVWSVSRVWLPRGIADIV
jgi:hypothetical protein